MTCLAALVVLEECNLNPAEIKFKIHKQAVKTKGTSAYLKYGKP